MCYNVKTQGNMLCLHLYTITNVLSGRVRFQAKDSCGFKNQFNTCKGDMKMQGNLLQRSVNEDQIQHNDLLCISLGQLLYDQQTSFLSENSTTLQNFIITI